MRPTSRPTQPYSDTEILDRVYQHFVVEQNPRCTTSDNDKGHCIYGKTGCAVGCLLTADDALILDTLGTMVINDVHKMYPQLYSIYFTERQLWMLRQLQMIHDRTISATLADRMKREINRLRQQVKHT